MKNKLTKKYLNKNLKDRRKIFAKKKERETGRKKERKRERETERKKENIKIDDLITPIYEKGVFHFEFFTSIFCSEKN